MKFHANSQSPAVAVTEMPQIDRPYPAALLSVTDVCRALQCGRTFVYELLQKGELRPIKLGRLTRISRTELDAFVEGKASDSSRSESGSVGTDRPRRMAHRPGAAASARAAPAVEQPALFDPAGSPAHRI